VFVRDVPPVQGADFMIFERLSEEGQPPHPTSRGSTLEKSRGPDPLRSARPGCTASLSPQP